MGRMVADVRWSVDLLSEIEFINPHQIFIVGYSLGGTIGLYSASLDDRIAGVASICGFTPMRPDTQEKGTEGIRRYSHLHGLLPRLGFFVGEEDKIPYDFDEILGCIAPRPLFIIAPSWDRFATHENVQQCVNEVRNIYRLYNANQNLEILTPEDYNRFSQEMQKQTIQWLENQFIK
jgi:pimeloyl-ACP methyl ester carboxylesterase